MKKNVASQVIGCQMVSATDGSAFTGAVTCYVTGDGGTQAAGSVASGACTHEGNGFHTYAPAQAETNYDHIAFTFTGTGAIPATVQVYPSFPQTGDSFARLGAPAGASISADIAAIEAQTDDIGVAGAGLTAIPWNAAWDAEVQSEVADALTAYDPPTRAELTSDTNSVLAAVDAVDNFVDTEIAAIQTTLGTPAGVSLAADVAAVKAQTAAIETDTGTDLPATLATLTGYVDTEVAAIKAKTDQLTFTTANRVDASALSVANGAITTATFGAGAIDAAALAADAANEIADALLNRNIAGGSSVGRTVKDCFRFMRNRKRINAGTLTVYAEDDTTSAWTATVTTAAGDPLSEVDPA